MNKEQLDHDLDLVQTGNGYHNDLVATTSDRLKKTVIELRKFQLTMADELSSLRKSINGLEKTTRQLDEKNGKLQSKFFWLTVIATIFTVIQAVQVMDIILGWVKGCQP